VSAFSDSLERTLQRAILYARNYNHEYATLEHLLLSLLEDEDATAVFEACSIDIKKLKADLQQHLKEVLSNICVQDYEDARTTAGFQRVIQRSVIHTQSSGHKEVTGANVLVAIFAEKESHAVSFLQEQDMTRYDAVNFISHGITKNDSLTHQNANDDIDENMGVAHRTSQKKKAEALELYCVNLTEF
jgi:ATP-dependent Clp protease ATP-binding subunit ClpA